MNFFCTKKHFDQYLEDKELKRNEVYGLSLPLALEAARWLFSL